MAEVSGISARISVDASGAAASINRLSSTLNKLGAASRGSSAALSKTAGFIKSLSKSVVSLPFKNAISGVKSFTSGLAKLGSMVKRVALMRALRSAVKAVGAAFKEGISNLYQWSSGIGGEFAANMNRATTALNYFKNSVGAAAAPLINALAPVLDMIVDKCVAALNAINQLFAKLTGAKYWTRATKQAASYGSAVSSAGSAAKEAMRYLAPFDELNVLPSNSGGGGGGGSGGGAGAGGLFEEMVEFDEDIANFADRLREAFDARDWEGLGTLIGGKVNEIIDSIDFGGIGTKVGTAIGGAISTAFWALKTTDFVGIGSGLATFLNNVIAEINFSDLGGLMVQKLLSGLDVAIGFIFGTGEDGSTGLDFGAIGSALGNFVRGAFNRLSEWVKQYDWETFGQTLVQKIVALIKGIDITSTAKAIFEFLKSALSAAFSLLKGVAEELWNQFSQTTVGQKINEVLEFFKGGSESGRTGGNGGVSNPKSPSAGLDEQVTGKDALKAFGIGLGPIVAGVGFKSLIKGALTGSVGSAVAGISIASLASVFSQLEQGNVIYTDVNGTHSYNPLEMQEDMNEWLRDRSGGGRNQDVRFSPSQTRRVRVDATSTQRFKQVSSAYEQLKDKTAKAIAEGKQNSSFENVKAAFDSFRDSTAYKTAAGRTATSFTNVVANYNSVSDGSATKTVKGVIENTLVAAKEAMSSIKDTKATVTVQGNIADSVKTVKDAFDSLTNKTVTATANGTKNTNFNNTKTAYDSVKSKTVTLTANANGTLVAAINNAKSIIEASKKAGGGVFSGGAWHSITAYASGGSPLGGQLFLAREAGPELVGTLRGHTAVMNNDQIVASVSAGVARAITGISFHMNGIGFTRAPAEEPISEEAMYRAFKRALDETDFGGDTEVSFDGRVFYTEMVRQNRANTLMTGSNALA